MRLAFLSDIHANDLALQWVERDMRDYLAECNASQFDAIWLLGDLIGYLPWPVEVLTRLRRWDGELGPVSAVAGNHEALYWDETPQDVQKVARRALQWMEAKYADDRNAEALFAWLRDKISLNKDVHGGSLCCQTRVAQQLPVFVCHSNWNRTEFGERWPYLDDYESRKDGTQRALGKQAILSDLMAVRNEAHEDSHPTVLFCGHNHIQFAYSMNGLAEPSRVKLPLNSDEQLLLEPGTTYLVSTGSVGLDRTPPEDVDHLWFYYLILEIVDGAWQLRVRLGSTLKHLIRAEISKYLTEADEITVEYRRLLLQYLA